MRRQQDQHNELVLTIAKQKYSIMNLTAVRWQSAIMAIGWISFLRMLWVKLNSKKWNKSRWSGSHFIILSTFWFRFRAHWLAGCTKMKRVNKNQHISAEHTKYWHSSILQNMHVTCNMNMYCSSLLISNQFLTFWRVLKKFSTQPNVWTAWGKCIKVSLFSWILVLLHVYSPSIQLLFGDNRMR